GANGLLRPGAGDRPRGRADDGRLHGAALRRAEAHLVRAAARETAPAGRGPRALRSRAHRRRPPRSPPRGPGRGSRAVGSRGLQRLQPSGAESLSVHRPWAAVPALGAALAAVVSAPDSRFWKPRLERTGRGGTRTHTPVRTRPFESRASAFPPLG